MFLFLLASCADRQGDSAKCVPTSTLSYDRDADGVVDAIVRNTYDDAGNTVKEEMDLEADGRVDWTTTYTFDADGNMLVSQGANSTGQSQTETCTYDALGDLLTDHWDFTEEGGDEYFTVYTYDAGGHVLTSDYSDFGDPTQDFSERWTYDTVGNVLTWAFDRADGSVGAREVWTYDSDGYLITDDKTWSASEWQTAGDWALTYAYSEDRLTVTEHAASSASSDVAIYVSTYEPAGLLLSYTWDLDGDGVLDGKVTYAYDVSGNLLTETDIDGVTLETYTYDADNNELTQADDTDADGTVDVLHTSTWDDQGRVLSVETATDGVVDYRNTITWADCP